MIVNVRRLLFLGLFVAAMPQDPAHAGPCDAASSGFFAFDSTRERFDNSGTGGCFDAEFRIIAARRNGHAAPATGVVERPPQIVGLGLSGGGIKASAFHLGLLSGLHAARDDADRSMLRSIDYIASVSGGSWANGAYWNVQAPDQILFECLNRIARGEPDTGDCEVYRTLLPDTQDKVIGSQSWKRQVRKYLPDGDPVFSDATGVDYSHLARKPFPIFLATHSNTYTGQKTAKNFPFQMTPLGVGTIADCRSIETPCGFFRLYFRPLHWNNRPEAGFFVEFASASDIRLKVEKYVPRDRYGFRLSDAMWSSGGLVAKVFSLHLRVNPDGETPEGIREKYVLSDGGKADNIGLIPLVERRAELVILSQIAGDPEIRFGDLQRAGEQVSRLFGVHLATDELTSDDGTVQPMIRHACYRAGDRPGNVVFIKPTPHNIGDFSSAMAQAGSGWQNILPVLAKEGEKSEATRFPQNKTVSLSYPQNLMYAYFSLGQHVGRSPDLAREIAAWKNGSHACQ